MTDRTEKMRAKELKNQKLNSFLAQYRSELSETEIIASL